ncbi:hypothetical protein RND71_016095 [Anisodus tanguticus]|uniref:TF-B3 domain-containing protein n=1 Tax=Anisodus tanguticus TaxID=243964 RepID=A0AAE1S7V7_9SOLA|nr:hypothetical protein RND71_016095 [Anisodus tanguticus]
MEGGDNMNDHQFPNNFPMFPEISKDNVIDADPISYIFRHQSSSSSTAGFPLMYPILDYEDNDASNSTPSLFPDENPLEPTLSLFPQVSTDLCLSLPGTPVDTSSNIITQDSSTSSNNASDSCVPKRLHNFSLFPELFENLAAPKPIASTASLPSTDLCLSLPCTPNTSSTIVTQDSYTPLASSSNGVVSQNSAKRRLLFQESNMGPSKKHNDTKRHRLIVPRPVAGEEEHWITKKLTKSDVNGASRLLLPRQEVKNYILPFMDEQQAIICEDICGIDVTVLDLDTETEHILTLKKWSNDSFQLVKAWTTEFVKRRNLKEDDVIEIRWEKDNSRFCFRVHNRHQV